MSILLQHNLAFNVLPPAPAPTCILSPYPPHSGPSFNVLTIQGALLANVLTSTGSWPDVLQNGTRTPWTVRACWFCGIVFALASVLTAASQSIRLHRMSCRVDANASIRGLLSRQRPGPKGEVLPRQAQVLIWQMSVLYLIFAALLMLCGMFVLLWAAVGGEQWWDGQAQLAVTFTIVAAIVMVLFMWEQFTLFSWDGPEEGEENRISI